MTRHSVWLIFAVLMGSTSIYAGSTSSASATATVLGTGVGISTNLQAISLADIDLLDTVLTSGSSDFTIRSTSSRNVYDVWLSVDSANLNPGADIYLARDSSSNNLPLVVALTGGAGENAVSANPAALQTGNAGTARPNTGRKADGDGVAGTTLAGTSYRVTLTEDNSHFDTYTDIPAGTYTLVLTANVSSN